MLGDVSDLPLSLPAAQAAVLAAALDQERKIDRALESLGPISQRDVVVVGAGRAELERLAAAGARVTPVEAIRADDAAALPDASADAVVSAWSAFRGVDPAELEAADRVLRPGGRLLVLHDYGRDDVSRLRGDLPEYGAWSRRDGPFLTNGFRVRVLHCFWTFEDLDTARMFLDGAFGDPGAALGAELKRPRLAWNVAIYHRDRGGRGDTSTSTA
jgi:SAM-dependent methyltransferase